MRNRFTFLLFFAGQLIIGQQCFVFDKDNGFPIENVSITNEMNDKVVLTDKNGRADLSSFSEMDILFFTHITYVELEVLKKHILNTDLKVFMQFKAESLDEVFLSVTKNSESRSRIAEQVAVFSIKDIQRFSPQNAADMLSDIPGIRVQRTQFGGGSPVLRGMESNRVLLVVDGVRMNNAIYRKGHLQNSITVSPNILERTEVIFGPSSVIYGSDALGGVVHYYTRKPRISETQRTNVDFMTRYSSVNNEFTSYGGIELQFPKFASFTAISYSNFSDLRMGKNRRHGFEDWGKQFFYSDNTDHFYNPNPVVNDNPSVQRNIGYEQVDILQKVTLPVSKNTDILFNLQYSTSSDIPRYDKLNEYGSDELKYAEWHYGPQNRFLLSTQLLLNPNRSFMKTGTITLAYQDIEESNAERRFSNLDRSSELDNIDVFSVNADFSTPLNNESKRVFSYGAELTYNDVTSTSLGETLEVEGNRITGVSGYYNTPTRYPDGGSNYTSMAAYVDFRQDLTPQSTLNTGVRLTHTDLHAKWIDSTFFDLPYDKVQLRNTAVTLTAGYIYKPTSDWQINGVFSSGFRSPNIDDIGKVREKRGKVSVPNTNLRPEYAYNFELGINKFFFNRNYYLSLTTYYTLLDDYIYRAPYEINGSSTIIYEGEELEMTANVNMDKAYVVGSTLLFKGNFTRTLTANASVTVTKGRSFDTDEPMSSIPPVFGNVGLDYNKNRWDSGLYFRFNGRKKLSDYNLEEGIDNVEETPFIEETQMYYGTPSWMTLDYYLRYRITNQIHLQAGVDNVFDEHYKEFASGISAPGRNYILTLSASF